MSVRVIARIRPLLKLELEKDIIVDAEAAGSETPASPTVVRIPNPKNESESFTFQFNSVYSPTATQQQIFEHEVAPTVKHLFNGFDVTIFAYGVTGTGKTHTMRGGKSLADRGVIPRLLSSIYRRARKMEKDSQNSTQIEVAMSYYEIYNDKVYDLFEPPEKRTPAGLPIRDNNGKTVVVGLTEKPCTTLKDFEQLYDKANINRSTSATKLNAHSSRSHAILYVKLTQTTEDTVRISRASAIDLAGSEDNRRTDNNKERLVESASINKSLFVLAQCVEAISKKQSRIPYRESKMTRILSLGQNNGITLMILNLAPVRSYHLDTLSSLNFANRTKKIEVCEVENEPMFRNVPPKASSLLGPSSQRQPLRPLSAAHNLNLHDHERKEHKPIKEFSVYSDKNVRAKPSAVSSMLRKPESHKRHIEHSSSISRPQKAVRPSETSRFTKTTAEPGLSKESIEALIERRIEEKLAEKALNDQTTIHVPSISEDLQRRLDALEQRVAEKEDSRAEGLQYLLMAKQHQVRGEDGSALKMYQLALPYFPGNEKLAQKMMALQEKLRLKREQKHEQKDTTTVSFATTDAPEELLGDHLAATLGHAPALAGQGKKKLHYHSDSDGEYQDELHRSDDEDASYIDPHPTRRKPNKPKGSRFKVQVFRDESSSSDPLGASSDAQPQTPRTRHLLSIINTRDVSQIRLLKGVGAKKAESIVSCLCEMDGAGDRALITDLEQLGGLRGVGVRTVMNMREGLAA